MPQWTFRHESENAIDILFEGEEMFQIYRDREINQNDLRLAGVVCEVLNQEAITP